MGTLAYLYVEFSVWRVVKYDFKGKLEYDAHLARQRIPIMHKVEALFINGTDLMKLLEILLHWLSSSISNFHLYTIVGYKTSYREYEISVALKTSYASPLVYCIE